MTPPRRRAPRFILLAAAFAVAGGACSAPAASPHSGSPAPGSPTPIPTADAGRSSFAPTLPLLETVPPSAPPIVGEAPAERLAAVLDDLAGRIGADAAANAEAIVAEAMTWPDGSLGCRVPGEVYPQVLTPGYRVVLLAAGVDYDYRMAEAGIVRLCESGKPRP